jgi:sugar lactone lactonase YvrE
VNLVELNPLTGEVLDEIPLDRSGQGEAAARDLTIDAGGNIYILFARNDSQIAAHMLDPQGNFVRRFGRLAAGAENPPEGAFLDPRAIAISPDGRYIFIADGNAEAAFLTALLVGGE